MLSDNGRGVVKVKKRERSIVNILPQNKAKKKAESKGKDELKGTQYFFVVLLPGTISLPSEQESFPFG